MNRRNLVALAAVSALPAMALAEGASSQDRVARNLKLMKEGDGAFNRRDQAYFEKAHHPEMAAHIMGSLTPIKGRAALAGALGGMLKAFPDMKVDNDYPIQLGGGEWTTVVGKVTGTFSGEMALPDGKVIPGTGKAFDVYLTTTARWQNDLMVEEWVFWDSALMSQQIGLA